MIKNYFLLAIFLFSSISLFSQGKLQKNQEFLFHYGSYGKIPIGIFEVVRDKSPNSYRQYLLRNSDSVVELVISIEHYWNDSLRTNEEPYKHLTYLEFSFIKYWKKAQFVCTEKQAFNLKYIKSIITALCDIDKNCGNCSSSYGLQRDLVEKFTIESPVKFLNE